MSTQDARTEDPRDQGVNLTNFRYLFRMKHLKLWLLCMVAAVSSPLIACKPLPPLEGRSVSTALAQGADTRLGQIVAPLSLAHPGHSGVFALADGRDAFAARALLARAAERTIDVQYYIWNHDMSGTLLFEALHRAADRGVRVRMLLDDNNTAGMDDVISMLDAHPNIEVRLFNPFTHRRWRALGYLTDFRRLNRRMHNKSFTVDNQVTIIGGRNVGDEYFGAAQNLLFVDLDVMAIGPVVGEASRDFDRYWMSGSSYPAERVLQITDPEALSALSREASLVERNPAAARYVEALASTPFVRQLLAGRLPLEWAHVRMVSDDPAKGLGQGEDGSLVTDRLRAVLEAPKRELQLVSPYFVPTAAGVDALVALKRQGVDVSVLTNSLAATDVTPVHAGYVRYRKPLLKNGVTLYEMKGKVSELTARDRGITGSSASSLHAKTFSVDRSRLFIGSFNFDPRSARLNTENGFVIESATLANALAGVFSHRVPVLSYEVRLDASGALQWIERLEGATIVHEKEPAAGFWRRATVAVLSVLPIEGLL